MSTQEPLDTPKPWKTGEDDPQIVLSVLIDKAVEKLAIPADIEARLRHRVGEDPEPLLYPAEEHRLYYKQAAFHLAQSSRLQARPIARSLVRLAYALISIFVIVVAPFIAVRQIGLTFPHNTIVTVTCISAFGALLLLLASTYHKNSRSRLRRRLWTLILPISLGGYIFVGTAWGSLEVSVPAAVAQFVITLGVLRMTRTAVEQLDLLPLEQQASTMFEAWRSELFEQAVLPTAIEEMNRAGAVYATSLRLSTQSYMDPDTVLDLETPTTGELRQLLEQNRGTFSLAGPRGSGKTTLLERWCTGHYLPDKLRVALSVRVDAPTGYDPKEFVVYLFGRVCDEVERLDSSRDPFGTNADLIELARQNRNKIRYLQSRTTERELAIDVTWGAKLGAKRKVAIKRDTVPLNHPELVDEFRSFLRRISGAKARSRGRVLIGIDELDRISDGSQAEKFINELKAVFNIPHCFFLVSVSDDALADFELSAMGMRTAFDSSFDAVVRVDYMAFNEARRLLNLRVVNLPEQFAALAYATSGGLARELIRMVNAVSSKGGTLAEIAAKLVQHQLERTVRAATDRLLRLSDRAAGAKLIPKLDAQLYGDLREYAARIEETHVSAAAKDTRLDVVVMAEYLATILAIFDDHLDKERMQTGLTPGPGSFENLARVRRYLGANPYGARELLREFGRAWKLH